MRIKWYGTATLLLECGNTRILVDPYLKKYNPKLPRVPVEEAATAHTAFITHPHLDHFADIETFINAGVKRVYVSENGIHHAQDNQIPSDCMLPLGANERYEVGDFIVSTYQSRHCLFDAATVLGVALNPATYCKFGAGVALLKETKKFKITDDIFALQFVGDGKTLMVLGSAGMDENIAYPTGADLLVFPYQGRARMHRYMIPFLKTFQPKKVMIDHHDDAFPPLTHTINTKKFLPTVKKYFPETEAFIPVEGEWYEV